MQPVIAKSSRVRWAILTGASLCFVIAGAAILATGGSSWAAWPSIIFFGGCSIVGALQLFDNSPRLIIDDRGVFDRTLKLGFIDWNDINNAFVKRIQGNAFICLELRDPGKYLGQLSPLLRQMVEVNKKLGFTEISLNLANTDLSAEQVCELILKEAASRRAV